MKNFFKNIFLAFLIFTLFFILGCSAEESTSTGVQFVIQGYTKYSSPEGYSFQVPANWNKINVPPDYVGFADSTGSRLLSVKSDGLDTTSYDDAINNIKSALSNQLANNKILYEEDLRISGKRAKKIVYYYGESDGEEFKHGIVIINDDSNNVIVLLSFTTYFNFYDTDAIVLQNAISTFRFD